MTLGVLNAAGHEVIMRFLERGGVCFVTGWYDLCLGMLKKGGYMCCHLPGVESLKWTCFLSHRLHV